MFALEDGDRPEAWPALTYAVVHDPGEVSDQFLFLMHLTGDLMLVVAVTVIVHHPPSPLLLIHQESLDRSY